MSHVRTRLTGAEGDVYVLDVARRIANRKDVSVLALVPKNYKVSFSGAVKKKFDYLTHLSKENEKLRYTISEFDSFDLSKYLDSTTAGQSSYDLIVCGFTPPLPLRQEDPALGATDPSVSAGLMDECYVEDLGIIGSAIKNEMNRGYLMVVHEPSSRSAAGHLGTEVEAHELDFSHHVMRSIQK